MSKTTHARRITAMILAAAMMIGMTPTIAFAADVQELTYTPMGATPLEGIITGKENPDHPSGNYYASNYVTAYYGDNGDGSPMAWYVLDNEYPTNGDSGEPGILMQTKYLYNFGTQWNAYIQQAGNCLLGSAN